jgi:quinol monooxygenase YgiN
VAIVMIADASEQQLAHYDQVIADLEAAGLGHPPGRLVHVAARKGASYVVTDVWESQEALDAFFQTLGPPLKQAGGDAEQQVTQILPVHNLITGA